VRGEFACPDKATENKRLYPKKIWEKVIGRVAEGFKNRSMLGHASHPADGRTDIDKVTHVVTELKLEDGILIGEAEILPTDRGKNLLAILQSGCLVGVSSRGFGSTKPNDNGEDVVQEDYKLVTFDFVADPADPNAYPKIVDEAIRENPCFEGMEIQMAPPLKTESTSTAPLVSAVSNIAERADAAAKSENQAATDRSRLADEVLAAIAAQKSDVRNDVRAELLADPTVAGAKTALEQVVSILRPYVLPEDAESVVRGKETEIARLKNELLSKDLVIEDLKTENSKVSSALKKVGYQFVLERTLVGDPDAEFIRKVVGDVTQYSEGQALKDKVVAVREELKAKRVEEQKAKEVHAAEAARVHEIARQATATVEAENSKLREALDSVTAALQETSTRLYTEKKLRFLPNKGKVRGLIEAAKPTSKKRVDELLESFRKAPPKDEDDAATMRARIRARIGGGYESDPISEETPRKKPRSLSENYVNEATGMDLDELLKLSGTA
jgi:hypothetical protein